jgi:hypothetical protein
MPMLADLDNPPRSRARDLLLGFLVGLPIVGLVAWFIVPGIFGVITGNADTYDQRLRAEDGYMQTLCTTAMSLPRDEDLCKCVLASEVPSLDCRPPFLRWSLDRHTAACADAETHRRSLTFCSCVETVAERAAKAGDDEAARLEAQRVSKCIELPDAFPLPEIEALGPPTPPAS